MRMCTCTLPMATLTQHSLRHEPLHSGAEYPNTYTGLPGKEGTPARFQVAKPAPEAIVSMRIPGQRDRTALIDA